MKGLTKKMAIDLAPKGVRVNSVIPGGNISLDKTDRGGTNMLLRQVDSALSDPEDGPNSSSLAPNFLGLNKTGNVHEIAAAVKFLASDDASFVTGQTLAVDGGASLKPL